MGIARASPQSTRGSGTGLGHNKGIGKILVSGDKTCSLLPTGDVLYTSDMIDGGDCFGIKRESTSGSPCTVCSKAAVKSCTVTKRSMGSLAKALKTTSSTALSSF